jgi:hypothetical protein
MRENVPSIVATPESLEVDPEIYACPDGPRCQDPECIAENERRAKERAALDGIEDDIPVKLACDAHRGTSFDPAERGRQVRREYVETLRTDYARLAKYATTAEKLTTLAEAFSRYRRGYLRRCSALLLAKSACMSTMIAGPSNFPTRRNDKRNRIADKRSEELREFREHALTSIMRTLRPELKPIMAGDGDAEQRITAKLQKREALQAAMKAANAAIRREKKRGPAAQVAALVALGFEEQQAADLLQPDFAGRIGFAAYEIQNNGAEIRRLKGRLKVVAEARATPAREAKGEYAQLEDCPAENRVRLYFPGKPEQSIRKALKGAGFRWAPTLGCWQAYRNPASIQAAETFAGVLDGDSGEPL